jgi:hypothetical protein
MPGLVVCLVTARTWALARLLQGFFTVAVALC